MRCRECSCASGANCNRSYSQESAKTAHSVSWADCLGVDRTAPLKAVRRLEGAVEKDNAIHQGCIGEVLCLEDSSQVRLFNGKACQVVSLRSLLYASTVRRGG